MDMRLAMTSITYLLARNFPVGSIVRIRLRRAWPVVFVVVAALLLGAIPTAVQAQSTVDYDTNDNGLIEVAGLAQLNAIRWDLDGDGSSGNAGYAAAFPNAPDGMGCPSGVCSGYELTTDLDFDTDGDSVSGPGDDYWNEGSGWDPIGEFDSDARFNTTFDGNGHTISNLYINRMTERWIGLFGFGNWGSTVSNLGLIDVNVNGDGYVGGVMGGHYQGRITACFSTGQVSGHDMIGGLIGRSSRGKITTSYSTATVRGDDDVGGLVGWLETNGLAVVRASYATGSVSGDQYVAGLVGYHASGTIQASYATGSVSGNGHLGGLASGTGSGIVTDSYWDTQRTGQAASIGGMGKTTAELRAPTGYVGAYANWYLDLDGVEGGEDPWDFGDTNDYPLLKVDFNGDDDATWQEFGTQQMVPDPPVLTALVGSANQFTVDWSAPVGDGQSDVIAYDVRYILTNADPSSDSNWTVVEDAWTVGPFAHTVTGLGNGLEYAAEVRAVNAVGASRWSNPGNDYDTDDDNLIEIDSLARLNAVRWDLDGNGASDLDADASRYLANRAGYLAAFPNGAPRMGCPAVACDGYELTADLDFDTDGSGIYASWNSGETATWNFGAGDQYPVLVVDLDGNGDASWQEFGDQRTLTPPGAPTIESFTRAPGQLTVAWSAPEHDGGGEIMSYLVRFILSSRDQTVDDNWTVVYGAWTSGALEYTVTGLEFDAGKYTMQVKAANQRFAGGWSAAESTSTIVAPILTVSDSEPAPGDSVHITATLRQPDSGATYQWQRLFRQWRDVGPASSTKRVIFDSAGTRIYRAVVTLSNGDIVRSAPLSLTWE